MTTEERPGRIEMAMGPGRFFPPDGGVKEPGSVPGANSPLRRLNGFRQARESCHLKGEHTMLKHRIERLAVMSPLEANVIKVLYITGVIAVILAGILFALTVFIGVPADDSIEDSPSVIQRFKETLEKSGDNQESLLEQEAAIFAQHLDFQEEEKETVAERTAEDGPAAVPSGTPKFRVFATSYFEANPEMSLALIDEPGKGKHWVRQSSIVGHFSIEQVKNGLVVVKSGEKTFELPLEKRAGTSLPGGTSVVSTGAINQRDAKISRI